MPTLSFNLKTLAPYDRIFNIGKDARLPMLQVQVLDGLTAVSLVGATVKFTMTDTIGNVIVNNQPGSLVSGTTGIVGYSFAAADVDVSGRYFGKFTITVGGVDYSIPNCVDQNLIINIGPAIPIILPIAITSTLTAAGTTGVAFSYQITATNSPTSYNATPLPTGLTVNTGTGAITGTPTVAGTTSATISATNADGTGTAMLVITIS